jgi:hypothetical protein
MSLTGRIVARWLQLAALATAMCMLVYLAVQQTGRQIANDPQIQIARDAASALSAGQPLASVVPQTAVDLSSSLSTWVTVTDENGNIVASSAKLHGQPRTVPKGILDNARSNGEWRVTWQPEQGVRMATITTHNRGPGGGFVVVGRSLRESEERTAAYGKLILLGWVATLLGLAVVIAATEAILPSRLATA